MVVESFFRTYHYSMWERAIIRVLRCGPIPNHIAFIMDGSRRWAKAVGKQDCFGQSLVYDRLSYMYHLCQTLGVSVVTVYAFSIENFKRSQKEVDFLMAMFEAIFEKVNEEIEEFKRKQVCLRVYGKVSRN